MGLPMVYGCIANHQGWLHVVSELGQGTTFFIFLPKYRPASNETAQNPDNSKLTTTTENAT
ncbi:MAG: HAMP domain-containing histidine kinase [Victivallales bacterium]|nr:HAMP domain-containing histidine kinase [Victivallales bacterium]